MFKRSVMILFLLGLVWPSSRGFCQSNEASRDKKSEIRAAGAHYQASGLHKFFFGAHYRDEWATPIEVPYLDLGAFAGGLTAYQRGGGKQTKSLRFKAAADGEYQFRSIDKDPLLALPPELRNTIAADVVQDQISSAHPYGALVVPPLAEAVGVLHANPRVVIMPDDARLDEFRQEFAGILGLIEERPVEGPNGAPGFAGAKKVESTEDMIARLEKEEDDFVDQHAFLTARLLDIYLGDWDRHFDQWRWARFQKDSKEFWYPIPRDRDQAFAKFDGLFPALAEKRFLVPQLEGFNKDKPDIWSLTYSGRHLDRIFLNELTQEDFARASKTFVEQLKDETIEQAVRRLPPPIYDLSGAWLEHKLKARRQFMAEAAQTHYKNLAKYTDIVGRHKPEYVEIDRADNGDVEVKIFKRDKSSGEKKGEAWYHRVFKRHETKEIRLYLFEGDDKVVLRGSARKSILLRLIGGPGNDEFVDQSHAKTIIYDTFGNTQMTRGRSTKFKGGHVDSIINAHDYQPLIPDHGSLVKPVPFLAYNDDDGLFLGAGIALYDYGFRKVPYASKSLFKSMVALKTSAFRLGYEGDYLQCLAGLRLNIEANVDRPRVRNFFGLGNQTRRDEELENKEFYEIRSKELFIRPLLFYEPSRRSKFFFGAGFRRFSIDSTDNANTLIVATRPYGLAVNNTLELTAGFTLDHRDSPIAPSKGALLSLSASHIPKAFDNASAYTRGEAMARLYLSPFSRLTLAAGVQGVKLWGTAFPYYDAAYIGGTSTLRGFARDRFAGDASVDGVAAVVLRLFRYHFLFPTDFGIFVFGDAGRVWLNSESPGDWHTSVGGGLLFAPILRTLTFTLGAARSTEDLRISISGGFRF
ncbi:MAG: outer membrane protein assembly factor [candidate division KSB1 bacterium]|nr:outer membrane protein assembly factor [candidate division KSB1 bacterium]